MVKFRKYWTIKSRILVIMILLMDHLIDLKEEIFYQTKLDKIEK